MKIGVLLASQSDTFFSKTQLGCAAQPIEETCYLREAHGQRNASEASTVLSTGLGAGNY